MFTYLFRNTVEISDFANLSILANRGGEFRFLQDISITDVNQILVGLFYRR